MLRWHFLAFSIEQNQKVNRAQRPPIRQTCMKELTVLFMVLCVVEKTPKVWEMVPALRDKCHRPPTHTHMLTLGSVQGVTPGCPKHTGDEEKPPRSFRDPPDINWVPPLHFPSFFKLQLKPGSRLVTGEKGWIKVLEATDCKPQAWGRVHSQRYPLSPQSQGLRENSSKPGGGGGGETMRHRLPGLGAEF